MRFTPDTLHRWECALVVLFVLLTFSGEPFPIQAQTATGAIGVYYVGPQDIIAEAIQLAAPHIVLVDQPELAQVLVINNTPPSEATLDMSALVQQGDIGLVLFSGQRFPVEVQDLSDLMGISTFEIERADTRRTLRKSEQTDPLQTAVAWNSAPPVYGRTVIFNPNLLLPLITTGVQEPAIQRVRGRETTQVLFVDIWLSDASNVAWQNWPYLRYLVYRLIADAAASPRVLSFSEYPLSPVPQGRLRFGITAGGLGVMLLVTMLFYRALRHLYMRPETLSTLRFRKAKQQADDDWNVVGFHRQLSSMLFLLTFALVTVPVSIWYRTNILPRALIPWSQPLSFWEQVAQWFEIAWLLFDLGTGVAIVRYFAALRPHHPREAFRYFQCYMWWQLLSNALKLGVVAILAAIIVPQTALAHLSFYFLIHALIQFPGFLKVFGLFFRAIQRLHYEQGLVTILALGAIVFQSSAVILLRRWGAEQPAIGEALGGVWGLGIGLYLAEWITFIIGLWLYRHRGYCLRALLTPGYDRHILGQILSFGGRLTFGKVFVALGAFVQTNLLTTMLSNHAQLQPDLTFMIYITSAYEILSTGLYNGLMPAMTEALSLKYKSLLRYYVGQGIHYGMWLGLFLLGTLGALAGRVMTDTFDTTYPYTIRWIGGLLLWGAAQWMTWLPDRVLEAQGRPALTSWLATGEQVLRTGLMAILIPRWQLAGFVMAYIFIRILRILVSSLLVRRLIIRPRVYVWQTLVAPAGAALIIFNVLQVMGNAWQDLGRPINTVMLVGALYLSLPVYSFITALLGGWDDEGIAEFRRATRLSAGPLAWLMLLGVRGGANISPLHGRFPMALRSIAQEEAQSLTLGYVPIE